MERTLKIQVIVIGIAAIAALFVFNNIAVPTSITDSENDRFNEYVTYFTNCEGYTVEYRNFDTFEGGDNTIPMQASKMSSDITDVRDETGFATVYFDWEKDVIFYLGSGSKSGLQYCYFLTF